MSLRERREREQVQRRRLIISTARELAEAEGWSAVTTRRLAQQTEWSQPVLYRHFKAKEDIVQAVALEGFDELAEALGAACRTDAAPRAGLLERARAYLRFVRRGLRHHPWPRRRLDQRGDPRLADRRRCAGAGLRPRLRSPAPPSRKRSSASAERRPNFLHHTRQTGDENPW